MRHGSAISASATATPQAAETNDRACRVHSRPSSFNSLGLRRVALVSFDLDFGKKRSLTTWCNVSTEPLVRCCHPPPRNGGGGQHQVRWRGRHRRRLSATQVNR